jgi:hypothetical protein
MRLRSATHAARESCRSTRSPLAPRNLSTDRRFSNISGPILGTNETGREAELLPAPTTVEPSRGSNPLAGIVSTA